MKDAVLGSFSLFCIHPIQSGYGGPNSLLAAEGSQSAESCRDVIAPPY